MDSIVLVSIEQICKLKILNPVAAASLHNSIFFKQMLMNVWRILICATCLPLVLTFLEAMTAPVTQVTQGMAL